MIINKEATVLHTEKLTDEQYQVVMTHLGWLLDIAIQRLHEGDDEDNAGEAVVKVMTMVHKAHWGKQI